jgi:hypothetical protein
MELRTGANFSAFLAFWQDRRVTRATEELGFDSCIDHRAPDLATRDRSAAS